jgi:hypothetical protein
MLLPLPAQAVARWQRRPRRASALALLGALLALGTLWALQSDAQPAFARVRAFEAALPQHDPALSAPEGRTGRYLRFSNQIQRLGWNNVFNEMCARIHSRARWRLTGAGCSTRSSRIRRAWRMCSRSMPGQ